MKTFYFIRHGETEANKQGVTCGGDLDIPLNDHGKNQAEKAAMILSHCIKDLHTFFVSPMMRATQTARFRMFGHGGGT